MEFENPYEILGLEAGASEEEVKAAYEKLLVEEDTRAKAEKAYAQICEMKKTEKIAEEEKTSEKPVEEEKPAEQKVEAPAEKQETPQEEKKKATPGQMALGILAVVVLAAVLVALVLFAMGGKEPEAAVPAETAPAAEAEGSLSDVPDITEGTIPADGDPDKETCKGSYTADEADLLAAADTVVATMGDYELTNAQLQVYYWMGIQGMMQNNPYFAYMGVDVSKPLDRQSCALEPGLTWQQFFLKQALSSWQNYQAMAAMAKDHGHEMDEELKTFLKNLPEEMDKQAKASGFADAKALLSNNVGPGASIEDYSHFMEVYNLGFKYFNDVLDAAEPTDEEKDAYMTEHQEELAEGGITRENKVVTARHILISPENPENEEDWTKAEAKAKEILDQYLAGDQTSESFAKLAKEHTMDPGSKETGGLYEDIAKGQMVPEFDQWCFDESRANGNTDIVKTDYGYHIMYYVSNRSVWQEQVAQIILKETADKMMAEGVEKYPMEIHYGEILLGEPTRP